MSKYNDYADSYSAQTPELARRFALRNEFFRLSLMSTHLTFKLVGQDKDHGLVRFDDFVRFCESVFKCLKASEEIVSGSAGSISYRIADMRCESATIKLQPIRKANRPDDRKKVVDFFRDTVANIERNGKIDPRMSLDALSTFKELGDPLKHRTKRVVIGRTSLTNNYVESLSSLLDEHASYEGSVTGLLEKLNVHNTKNEFVLYPPVPGRQIPCVFPDAMLDEVRAGIKRNVTVYGTLFYRTDNALPARVHAKKIEINPDDSQLPTLFDVRDAGSWDTGGLSAIAFVRSLRDE